MPEIPRALNTRYEPSFLILKTGIFSKSGNLKTVGEASQWKSLCDKDYRLIAWVTHRLGKKDSLSVTAAELLGNDLNKALTKSCFSAVELDIEPLTGNEEWLVEFLTQLKSTLSPKLKLRLAVPFIAENSQASSWKKAAARKILSAIDGLDVMLYDSGSQNSADYLKLLTENIRLANQWASEKPEKTIYLGIPAYHERTKLHLDNFENIASFIQAGKSLLPNDVTKICTGNVALSFYAGWTLSPEDRKSIDELKKWLSETCPKGSP